MVEGFVAADRSGRAGLGQVLGGMLDLPPAQHRLRCAQREFAVRAGADAEVIAEAPVIEVVRRLPPGLGVGRDFVMLEARRRDPRLAGLLDVPALVEAGNALRRARGEHRVGFERELVVRQVRRLQRERALDVVHRHLQRLLGQRVHQVEVDVVVTRVLRELHRAVGFATVVDAAQALQAAHRRNSGCRSSIGSRPRRDSPRSARVRRCRGWFPA